MRAAIFPLLLITIAPATVWAQEFTWATTNGAITITGYIGAGGSVVIPEMINGLPVVAIGDSAFEYSSSVTNVVIASTVTNIGGAAFNGCSGLASVSIPEGVTAIGDASFYECPSLRDVNIPSTVVSVGDSAFTGCSNLTAINVNSSNTAYSSLEGVLLDKSQTELILCPGAKAGSYVITNAVTSIGSSAFRFCSSLSGVTMPNSISSIGSWAFAYCTALTNVTFGSGVTNIGYRAFTKCTGLTAVDVDPMNSVYSSLEGVLFDKNQTVLLLYPKGVVGSYAIPNTVNRIGVYAFEDCTGLINVAFPDGLNAIDPGAFYGCTSLVSVSIPQGVKSITNGVFALCKALKSVIVPSTVTNIGFAAFSLCSSLTNVSISNGLLSIDSYAFNACTNLLRLKIPPSVATISGDAFQGCTSIEGLYFEGNAPVLLGSLPSPTQSQEPHTNTNGLTVYYLPGMSGWSSTYGGRPATLWLPLIQPADVVTNHFGFNISWADGMTVVVQSCTNIASANWMPVGTNVFTGDSWHFSDPEPANYSARFYKISWP